MAVSHVASAAAASPATQTNTSLAVSKPTGTATGDVILLWLVVSGTSVTGITGPSGFTQISGSPVTDGTGPPVYGALWTRTVDGSEASSLSASWTGGANAVLFAATYRGVNAAGITSAVLAQVASSTSRPSPTLSTSVGSWIFTAWGDRSGSTWTVTDTERQDTQVASSAAGVIADSNVIVAAGSISRTATASATTSAGVSVIVSMPESAASITGSAALSGAGALTLAATPFEAGALGLSGAGALSLAAVAHMQGASVALGGDSALSMSASVFVPGSLGLGGGGTFSAVAVSNNNLVLSGAGTLAAVGTPFVDVPFALSGGGTLALSAVPAIPGTLATAGAGALVPSNGVATVGAALSLSGAGSLGLSAPVPAVQDTISLSGAGAFGASSGMTLVPLASIASSVDWSATGGTVVSVLGDSDDATYVTSSANPSNVLLDGTFGAVAVPAGDFIIGMRARKGLASSGTVTAKLYVATTLKSTVIVDLPDVLGDVYIAFPAADLTTITAPNWAAGVRITLEASAA